MLACCKTGGLLWHNAKTGTNQQRWFHLCFAKLTFTSFLLLFFSFAANHPDTFSWPPQMNIHVNYSVAAGDEKKKRKEKRSRDSAPGKRGTKAKTNAASRNNFKRVCDRCGTLRDGRYGSLAELCDQWNIHSCSWSSVKQPAGWLHLDVFLSPWLRNVTNDHLMKCSGSARSNAAAKWVVKRTAVKQHFGCATLKKAKCLLENGNREAPSFSLCSHGAFEAKSVGISLRIGKGGRRSAWLTSLGLSYSSNIKTGGRQPFWTRELLHRS